MKFNPIQEERRSNGYGYSPPKRKHNTRSRSSKSLAVVVNALVEYTLYSTDDSSSSSLTDNDRTSFNDINTDAETAAPV